MSGIVSLLTVGVSNLWPTVHLTEAPNSIIQRLNPAIPCLLRNLATPREFIFLPLT
jgi:hypothetical protein